MWAVLWRRVEFAGVQLRLGSALLLVATVLFPLIPGHVGLVCPLRATTGIPCPLCGMTTSVVATSRGRFTEAIAANPAGLLALAVALVVLLLRPRIVSVPVAPLIGLLGAMWVFELFRFSVL